MQVSRALGPEPMSSPLVCGNLSIALELQRTRGYRGNDSVTEQQRTGSCRHCHVKVTIPHHRCVGEAGRSRLRGLAPTKLQERSVVIISS